VRVLVTEMLSDAGLELLRQRFQVDVREDLARGDLTAETRFTGWPSRSTVISRAASPRMMSSSLKYPN
jgi:hypothetical protein